MGKKRFKKEKDFIQRGHIRNTADIPTLYDMTSITRLSGI